MRTSFRPDQAASQASNLNNNTVSVSIGKPLDIGLADWMSHLRDWLNQHGIEPADFRYNGAASGGPTYEASFSNKNQADLFAAECNKKHLR
jgi:hypothetical protein